MQTMFDTKNSAVGGEGKWYKWIMTDCDSPFIIFSLCTPLSLSVIVSVSVCFPPPLFLLVMEFHLSKQIRFLSKIGIQMIT